MEMFDTYLIPAIIGLCLVVGYVVKHWIKDVDNKVIPTLVVCLGVVMSAWLNDWAVTPEIILGGALSGLASTGLHQLFKQWIDSGSGKFQKK